MWTWLKQLMCSHQNQTLKLVFGDSVDHELESYRLCHSCDKKLDQRYYTLDTKVLAPYPNMTQEDLDNYTNWSQAMIGHGCTQY